MATETDFYNIVVVGNMNPRLHTPGWYRLVNLIDESEHDLAVNSPVTMSTPPISQLKIGDVSVVCQPERWEIQTSNADRLSKLKTVAGRIFDELLAHTPVSALGFNFNYSRTTRVADVGRFLATRLVQTQIGLNDQSLISGQLALRRTDGNRKILVALHGADKPSPLVSVANNYEYNFEDKQQFFNLAETISERYESDRSEAQTQTSLIVESLSQSGDI